MSTVLEHVTVMVGRGATACSPLDSLWAAFDKWAPGGSLAACEDTWWQVLPQRLRSDSSRGETNAADIAAHRVAYICGLVAVDFRHWLCDEADPVDGDERCEVPHGVLLSNVRPFYCRDADGDGFIRGSGAMIELLRRAVDQHGIDWYRPERMASLSADDERIMFTGCENNSESPRILGHARARGRILREIGASFLDGPKGTDVPTYHSFFDMLLLSRRRLFSQSPPMSSSATWTTTCPTSHTAVNGGGLGFVERLVAFHGRYQDKYVLGEPDAAPVIWALKLAQLTGMALLSADPCRDLPADHPARHAAQFLDSSDASVAPDYQLPRGLWAAGLLRYSPALESLIRQRRHVAPGSTEERDLRAGTMLASEELLRLSKERYGPDVNSATLDHVLWHLGRDMTPDMAAGYPHHLTITLMY